MMWGPPASHQDPETSRAGWEQGRGALLRMQWDPSPCPHLPCASRWWDGAGPTCYLVSLASCLYLRLGSMNTWPAGYVPGRGWGWQQLGQGHLWGSGMSGCATHQLGGTL